MKFAGTLILTASCLGLTACGGMAKTWVSADFASKTECKTGIEYLSETRPSRIESKKRSCRRVAKGKYVGKYHEGYYGPYCGFAKRPKDRTLKIETPNQTLVAEYFAQKTETVDAQTHIERK